MNFGVRKIVYLRVEVSDDNGAERDLALHTGHHQTDDGWVGYAKWPIPFYWMPKVEYVGAERLIGVDDQIMSCSQDGYFTIKKLGREATRTSGGWYYVVH